MEEKCTIEDQMWSNCDKNAVELHEEDDDEEALSLSDLPLIHQWRKDINDDDEEEDQSRSPVEVVKEDFDFCSPSKESEMCAADELFFKGRILPLRHSVSSEKGLLSRSISRSESMDHYYSGGLISSRSSSINSHNSMTSSSSGGGGGKLPPPRNRFHSHPSPSPRLHFPTSKQKVATRSSYSTAKSSPWSIFRLGLVAAPPEIAFQDLKTRNNKNFGSRNSTSSSISSSSNSNANNKKKKKKSRGSLIGGGGCRCSSDAVETVSASSRVVFIKRCASEGDVEKALLDDLQRKSNSNADTTMTTKQAAKKRLSHRRTFEWLKQLSLEESTADDV